MCAMLQQLRHARRVQACSLLIVVQMRWPRLRCLMRVNLRESAVGMLTVAPSVPTVQLAPLFIMAQGTSR